MQETGLGPPVQVPRAHSPLASILATLILLQCPHQTPGKQLVLWHRLQASDSAGHKDAAVSGVVLGMPRPRLPKL